MARHEKTIFEQLAPYAAMTVVPGVTVGRLNYSNSMDLYSDSLFQITATKGVASNRDLPFFSTALNETGQGFTGPLTLGQTNSKFSRGQPPANQVFVATHMGYGAAVVTSADPAAAQTWTGLTARDLFALITNFSWDLQIARGNVRTIGSLLEYPDVGGAWAVTRQNAAVPTGIEQFAAAQNGVPAHYKVKLPIPIIFPPLVNVEINAKTGSGFDLLDAANSAFIQVRSTLSGFLMTMPV